MALGIAAKVFYVQIDPLVLQIEEALPGANCGGCGQPGCSGAAVAIAQGRMPANGCVAGGAKVGAEIAKILGVEIKETEPQVARVGCRYPVARADLKYDYLAETGITDCRAAVLLYGGPKECPVGCIGLGSCVKACPFEALGIGPDGLPVVDESRCTGCGSCVRTCPMGIMNLTSVTNRILGEYSLGDCTAPCQRTCPAGIDIPEQIRQTSLGNYDEALRIIKERNPLPLICGRICPNPCELACRRNLADEPVAINPLKRFVADIERTSGKRQQPFKAPATGKKTAVIGCGVEGLTAAYFLARLGHRTKLFEGKKQLGGLLRTAIPENRLPREVLDWEIQGILDMGVEAETGRSFGRDFGLADLFDQGFDTALLAMGGWDALLASGQTLPAGPGLPGMFLLLPLNMAWATGQKVDIGRNVVILGGRDALKTARRCLKMGADKATILSPNTRGKLDISGTELEQAQADGIMVWTTAQVNRLMGVGDRLTQLAFRSGGDVERIINVDSLIVASGRLPEMVVVKEAEPDGTIPQVPGAQVRWRTMVPYDKFGRRPFDMFAGREPVSDFRAAVEAIGAGRRAAAVMHKFLMGLEIEPPKGAIGSGPAIIDVDYVDNLMETGPRVLMPQATPRERLNPKQEVNLGLDEEAARAEARRCLNCGLVCYYRKKYN
ncbi:MAG: (Fe-S)-binding protein [Pseudomonadota bacterium]